MSEERASPDKAPVRIRLCGWLLTDGTYGTHETNGTFCGNLMSPMRPIKLVAPKAWRRRKNARNAKKPRMRVNKDRPVHL